jgi:hypothetical protein
MRWVKSGTRFSMNHAAGAGIGWHCTATGWICAVLTGYAVITDDHMNRIRRPGERRMENPVAVRRIEVAPTA